MPCFQLRLWALHFPIDHIQHDLFGHRFGHASMPFFRAQLSHEMSLATTSPSFSVSLLSSSSPRVSSFRTLEICADETPDAGNSSVVEDALAMMNIGEDLKERLRRERIGMANRGRVPWNKGKRHTPETREKIRQRTKEALNDPKAIEKRMAKQPRSLSDQVRSKISSSQRRVWAKRLKWKRQRAKFCNSWSESIAEAARTGCSGQKPLQWDSYEIIREELTQIQIELAVEREKEREFARIWRESNPRTSSLRVRRAERKGISHEEKMRQKEEITKAKSKARQERRESRRREKLKERLSLIRQKILVQHQVPTCPEERVSSSQSPAWENLDIEVIKKESAQREVSLADQIMAAKKKREELAASLTVPSIRP